MTHLAKREFYSSEEYIRSVRVVDCAGNKRSVLPYARGVHEARAARIDVRLTAASSPTTLVQRAQVPHQVPPRGTWLRLVLFCYCYCCYLRIVTMAQLDNVKPPPPPHPRPIRTDRRCMIFMHSHYSRWDDYFGPDTPRTAKICTSSAR